MSETQPTYLGFKDLKDMMTGMTNGAAIGYMIMAAKRLGLDEKLIKELDREMYRVMDIADEEQAEKVYQGF